MSKQTLRSSNAQTNQTSGWQITGARVIYLSLAVLLILLVWLYPNRLLPTGNSSAWGAVGAGAVIAILAVVCERLLGAFRMRLGWRYRLALLIPVAIGLSNWLTSLGVQSGLIKWLWPLAILSGAFSGCLIATYLNEGIWENNSPPSQRIEEEVLQKHLEMIGTPDPTPRLKRLFDLIIALSGVVISAPVWFLSLLLVWLESPGPLLFVKNSVGKGGVNFRQFKLRTMVHGAEDSTGPVLAGETDERVLLVGRVLRKTALDELPQLINILNGEMSFVGPRPQRTVLVHGYLERMPEYTVRHLVLPGLSGLAQVAGDYYLTPRQKLRFDRLYIQHASLGFDLKLLFLAFLITFWYRWQKDWDGRLPRKLLRFGSGKRKF
jgi:lipopolysaccharide/colanic/teichoic acid biosynthesis glycosyltransferase